VGPERPAAEPGQVGRVEPDRAARDGGRPREAAQQRRLPRPGRADERDRPALEASLRLLLAAERWADNPLQLDYFGTYLAGEIFFDKLEEVRSRADAKPDLLEIYYFCLLLGFKGKYGVSGEEKLRSLIESVGAELGRLKPGAGKDLSPHWKIPDGPQAVASDKLPRWLVLTCWAIAGVALVLYLSLFFKIRHDAENLREDIQKQSAGLVGGKELEGILTPLAKVQVAGATAGWIPARAALGRNDDECH
jgi:hypothetical protein